MKAVIMAGGEGSRLRPLTSNLPKPMMPLANRPMMEHVIDLLRSHGFDEIVVTVAYLANTIRNYFGDGSAFGVKLVYATEETPLGTAGSVRNAMDELDERFLVISGDVLTDIDLSSIVDVHDNAGALATIGLTPVENPLEFGIVITNADGSIERFLEKPTWGEVFSDTINTGIFVLEPEIFDYIAPDVPVDFSSEVFPRLLAEGRPLFGAVAEGYWEDVGTLDAYVSAHRDILERSVDVHIPGFTVRNGVWMGANVVVDPTAIIEPPVLIGDNCRIGAGAQIREFSSIGANVRVMDRAELERVVIHDNTYVGERSRLRGTVVGRSSNLTRRVRCEEGAVLGDECHVESDATIGTGVKVYPHKRIEAEAVVNSSIVWESRGSSSLFGRDGVRGLSNVDITAEFVVRLAMAYGTTLAPGDMVVISRDSSRSARMLKRAMMAGLNSAGIDVLDLEQASVPVTRLQSRRSGPVGGVTARIVDGNAAGAAIRFFDTNGADITEAAQRKIERVFHREDFRQVLPGEIGEIHFAPRAAEHYTASLGDVIDMSTIVDAGFKLILDYSHGSTSLVMPSVLAKLGVEVLAINPFTSTKGAISYDPAVQAEHVSSLVRSTGSDLGAVLGPHGEELFLVDDEGHLLDHGQALRVLLELHLPQLAGRSVVLPIGVTSTATDLLDGHGVDVVRTKLSTASINDAAGDPGVAFAAGLRGGYIVPDLLPAFDATATLTRLLELLARDGRRLSDVVDQLVPAHVLDGVVPTPFHLKGALMRSLVELAGDDAVLVDGVRTETDLGWALVTPDPDQPLTHVRVEASSEGRARKALRDEISRVEELIEALSD